MLKLKQTVAHPQIVSRINRVIAQSMFVVYDRELQKKLTWKYLGIRSSTLRLETHAITKGDTVYVGTIPWYGHAYETGNWDRWKGREGNKKKYKRSRRATWTGDPKHRPFMSDTIRDKSNISKIATRVRKRLKNDRIMK